MLAVLATLLFNTLIAMFLTVIGVGGSGFPENLLWSQSIGLSIATMITLAIKANPSGPKRILAVVGAVTAGAAVGIVLAGLLGGQGQHKDLVAEQALFIGVFFGGIASAFFWLSERNANLAARLEAGELARMEAEKNRIEAQLKMLQAQIEPHFLFNTLANVASLIERDSSLASRLLDALIRYLRSSLKRTRAEGGTLGDEIGLLTAYLDVLKIRMGPRLRYSFDVPPTFLARPFPPMLLQPLVENAITHGLEPKVEGGVVRISAAENLGVMSLRVEDDGLGFAAVPGGGVGLANIRARLNALYGETGRFSITAKVGAGVTAVIEIPVHKEVA
jgi:sensor histidine kinase YesM